MENTELAKKAPTLQSLLTQDSVKKRFEEMLGKKAAGFISSIISATKLNKALAECEPNSILSASVIAATLDLPINQNLGFAAIVPYRENGSPVAQFQMMWRGFVQLAMRTGQYRTMNVCEVFEGELISENRFTGEYEFNASKKKSDTVIGYTASFKLINGFEKIVYWTIAQIQAHGKKYSKSFNNEKGRWRLDFDAMAKKTVLKMLLSKYGILSIDMQTALITDQAVIKEGELDLSTPFTEFDYVDGTGGTPVEPEQNWDEAQKQFDSLRGEMEGVDAVDAQRIIENKEKTGYAKLMKVFEKLSAKK